MEVCERFIPNSIKHLDWVGRFDHVELRDEQVLPASIIQQSILYAPEQRFIRELKVYTGCYDHKPQR